MEVLRKLGYFLFLCAWVLAFIGGTASHIYRKDYVFAVVNLVVCLALIPDIVTLVKALMGNGENN